MRKETKSDNTERIQDILNAHHYDRFKHFRKINDELYASILELRKKKDYFKFPPLSFADDNTARGVKISSIEMEGERVSITCEKTIEIKSMIAPIGNSTIFVMRKNFTPGVFKMIKPFDLKPAKFYFSFSHSDSRWRIENFTCSIATPHIHQFGYCLGDAPKRFSSLTTKALVSSIETMENINLNSLLCHDFYYDDIEGEQSIMTYMGENLTREERKTLINSREEW